jgi:hypothetical protein
VSLSDELARVAEAAGRLAGAGEEVTAVIPTEPQPDARVYLCAFGEGDGRSWLALDATGRTIRSKTTVRDAVTIAALCEIAEEAAGGVDGEPTEEPRLASPAYLDRIGTPDALRHAMATVDELVRDVESSYKVELE